MAFNYYSGDLAAINAGRTADAQVAAENARSFRNYLAMLAQNRTRSELGNREIDSRERIAAEDVALRRRLGEGALENDKNRIGVEATGTNNRMLLGILGLNQSAAESAQEYEIQLRQIAQRQKEVQANIDAITKLYGGGAAVDWRANEAIRRANEEKAALKAEAEVIASKANALLKSKAKSKDKWYWPDDNAARLESDPVFRREMTDEVISGLPTSEAAMITPSGSGFIVNPRYFGSPVQAADSVAPMAPQSLSAFERFLRANQ